MKKNEIKVGGKYRAKVSNCIVTVEVLEISKREGYRVGALRRQGGTFFRCRNLKTGREVVFRSAQKFRGEARTESSRILRFP